MQTGNYCQLFPLAPTPIRLHTGMWLRKEFNELFFPRTLDLIQDVAGWKLHLQFIHAIPLFTHNSCIMSTICQSPQACLFNFFLVKGCGVSCFATTIIPAISPYAHHGAACLGNRMLFPGQACTVTVPCHNRFTFHVSSWFSIYSHVWYRVTTLSRCCHRCDSSVPGMKMSPATIVSVDMTMLTPLCCCCCHHRFFFVAFPVAIIVVSSPFGIIVVE